MKTVRKVLMSLFSIVVMLLTSCSSDLSVSAPMCELADTYAEIAQNNQDVSEAFQAVYKASRDEQGLLQEKAIALSDEVKIKNAKLSEKAATLGDKLKDSEILCEASKLMGYTVTNAVFSTVSAQPQLANIVITATISAPSSEKPYFLFLDSEGETVYKTMGMYTQDGKASVNFHITTNKGADSGKTFAKVCRLMIVTKQEYDKGSVDANASTANVVVDSRPEAVEATENPESNEPEPAYTGEAKTSNPSGGVTVNGVTIQKGANLVETLKKFNKITWDYNADFGITATVGNVWITIDDTDLTQKGQDVINAIMSDMENNIKFSVDYIKPSAKIKQFEKN